eukprot:1183286-Prorocentrum_minimum.AAC.2
MGIHVWTPSGPPLDPLAICLPRQTWRGLPWRRRAAHPRSFPPPARTRRRPRAPAPAPGSCAATGPKRKFLTCFWGRTCSGCIPPQAAARRGPRWGAGWRAGAAGGGRWPPGACTRTRPSASPGCTPACAAGSAPAGPARPTRACIL